MSNPPQGYDIVKSNGERKIIINEEGKKLKKAWQWKLQGMKNEEIIEKLTKLGVKMYKQQLCKIFHNPFYCGLIAHGLLNGKVVDGRHEKMISKDDFYRIHKINEQSTRLGVPHKREIEELPLKVFMACSDCSQPMTGYLVKQKGLFYYKCRTKGCKSNKSAKTLHKRFLELLSDYSTKRDLMKAIVFELEYAYNEKNKNSFDNEQEFKKRIQDLKETIERLDEKYYIKEELTKEKYDKLASKLNTEHEQMCEELANCAHTISNLDEKLEEAIEFCCNLPKTWELADIKKKEKLQKLIFPEGIVYGKKTGVVRTNKVNSVIAEIARLSGDLAINTKGTFPFLMEKSLLAVREGFEPSVPVAQYDSLANCSFRPLRHLTHTFFQGTAKVAKNNLFQK